MSHKADINEAFNALIKKLPDGEGEILFCKFEIFEALEWDSAAKEVVKNMLNSRYRYMVNKNMMCYLDT